MTSASATLDSQTDGPGAPSRPPTVLLVDDNRPYREAFRRHLELHDIAVIEAEHSDEALAALSGDMPTPDMVITDLQMRNETEGLDLIRSIRSIAPIMPIALISAVGTFEEGAMAQRLGAVGVFSKATLDDDLTRLVETIHTVVAQHNRDRAAESILGTARTRLTTDDTASPDDEAGHQSDATAPMAETLASLRSLLSDRNLHPYLRAEAYSLIATAETGDQIAAARAASPIYGPTPEDAVAKLRAEYPLFDNLSPDAREALTVAEVLLAQSTKSPGSLDFSRNIGFSYCFAVECEAKVRMARRINKFLGAEATYLALGEMLNANPSNPSLTVYFHQHLLLLLRGRDMDITIDNFRQTLFRIHEHRSRYKPDGLKALGILLIAFGRDYTFTASRRPIRIANPLGLRGFDNNDQVLDYAQHLVSLQHYRNPYIHPEISDMEKITKIRATTLDCLELTSKVTP